jgi:hypothetical protein
MPIIELESVQNRSVKRGLKLRLLCAVSIWLVLVGCGAPSAQPSPVASAPGGSSPAPAQATSTVAPPSAPSPPVVSSPVAAQPNAMVELGYLFVDQEDRFLRFVGLIRNPHAQSIEGMAVRWDALDASGAIVGSRARNLPPIAAGSTWYYAGGAGLFNLTGVPESVKFTVTNPGRLSNAPSTVFAVEGVTVESRPNVLTNQPQATVTGTLTTGNQPVERRDVTVYAIVKDAEGNIIGATFDSPTSVPDTLDPGTRFRVEIGFIRITGTPVTAELIAYADPG